MSDQEKSKPSKAPSKIYGLHIRRPDLSKDSPLAGNVNTSPKESLNLLERLDKWRFWQLSVLKKSKDGVINTDDMASLSLETLHIRLPQERRDELSGRGILDYFCAAHECGVYPPPEVMNELYKRFVQYNNDNHSAKTHRLGEYFVEPSEGTPEPSFRNQALNGMVANVVETVHRLRAWCNCSREDALSIGEAILIQGQKGSPWSEHGRLKRYAALEKAYDKWRNTELPMIEEIEREHHIEFFAKPSPEMVAQFLGEIGQDALKEYPLLQYLANRRTAGGS
jgi:hypothetical protein